MKKTPFKKKPYFMKRSTIARKPFTKAVAPLRRLQDKLWELCKQITRAKYTLPDGSWLCFTCDKRIWEPIDAHTGHGIPDSVGGALLRYHLDNLRIQCWDCNCNKNGMKDEFKRRLIAELGQAKVDALYELKNGYVKCDHIFYETRIKYLSTFYPHDMNNC